MSLWIYLLAALALAGAAAGGAALRTRLRRRARLRLRLLAGRRRLLGEEIDSRCARLEACDDGSEARHVAEGALDSLHLQLIDREAHLQNLAELARMQRHKLAVLNRRRMELAELDGAEPTAAAAGSDDDPQDGSILERRERVRDRFLESIQQHPDTSASPERRRRRR